ncbi:hypothetical protein [Nocardioides aurantiacus]|uniref:Uncharacterized protein n=1 Tax=Nocardioides aurantiacus TaxID=86796 RepID=A0A3N2CTN4_9ACTN|nr:hypothetical protein [Nocardioides aurantiacus]ROR90881.1 hypothetical protein EDD33_1730 [Nocardioides aurantiacus]
MKANTLRDLDPTDVSEDIAGFLIGLAVWVVIIITAPILVLVLAAALLSIELPIVIAVAVLLTAARFCGLIPWSVVVLDPHTGTETHERYRNLLRAVARIRGVNHNRHVDVRWAWA